MKTYFRSCLCISLLLSVGAAIHADTCDSDCDTQDRTYSTISQPSHGDLLMNQNHYFNYEYGAGDCFSFKFNATYRYDHSIKEDENIACALFGKAAQPGTGSSSSSSSNCNDDCKNCESILLQGSTLTNRNQNALIAEQFGLGTDTDARVSFNPEIENHLFNFQMYMNLGELLEGLYFQADLPVVHSKWNLCGSDCKSLSISGEAGSRDFNGGCMDAARINNSPTPSTVAKDTSIKDISAALAGQTNFGDKTTNLAWDRIICGEKDDTKLASVNLALGYNFWECPDYHFGAYLHVAAPTGTEIGSDQDCKNDLFAPVIGSKHWELGGGMVGHFEICNWDDTHAVTAYMQGYVAHAFGEESRRTFDLQVGGQPRQLSRYALLKEFNDDGTYAGNLIQAANVTNRCVETKIDVKGEGILEFMYSNECGFDVSIGYNIWGQDNEELDNCKNGELPSGSLDNRNFGIKGCTPVQAVEFAASGGDVADPLSAVNLSSTQSSATMFNCPTALDNNNRKFHVVDNQQPAMNATNSTNTYDPCLQSRPANGTTITNVDSIAKDSLTSGGSPNPKLLDKENIDTKSGLIPSMVSHRIFGRLNYTFEDVDFTPYVGLGAFVALSDSDHKATPERAGFFLNGGISF